MFIQAPISQIILAGDTINRHSLISVSAIIEAFRPDIRLQVIELDELGHMAPGKNTALGLSFFTGQIPRVFQTVAALKKTYPHIILFAGGPHATAAPEMTLDAGFDFLIRGEGEDAVPMFLEMLSGSVSPDQVPGLSYRDHGNSRHNPPAPLIDLDQAYAYSRHLKAAFPIEITRGCPYACHFCQVSAMFGHRYRHRSVETVLQHVRKGMKFVRFVSTNAFAFGAQNPGEINIPQIVRLLEGVHRIDRAIEIYFGSFPSEVRPEYVTHEMLEILKTHTQNKTVAIGAQSGSDRLLGRIHRGHTTGDVLEAVEKVCRHGFKCKVDFIFGLPHETEDDLRTTLEFIRQLLGIGRVEIRIHTFVPLPGTGFAAQPFGRIAPVLKAELKTLIGRGRASGPWLAKEKINQELAAYFKPGQCGDCASYR